MDNIELDLRPRIGAVAVISGILVGLALAATMMALGTAIGVTAFPGTTSLRHAGLGFAGWFLLSLSLGTFAGGWIAAGAARVLRRRDGVLHGIVTWSAIALISLSLVGNVMRGAAVGMLGEGALPGAPSSVQQHGAEVGAWGAFAALFIPLCLAMLGGVIGVRRERRAAGMIAERGRRPVVYAPEHTGVEPRPRQPAIRRPDEPVPQL
jgi:hypothetical protein